MTSPRDWLAREPLQAGEQLFAILGNASQCKPVEAWRLAGGGLPSSVWANSEYGAWEEVMPYVAVVVADSPFLDWVAECEAADWGWLGVSSCPLQTVVDHLRSLTKVLLPEGQVVFFRFWDGTYLLPVLEALGPEAGGVIPVFGRYWINGQHHAVAGALAGAVGTSPWWEVPPQVLKQLGEHSTAPLVDNLLQWLEEERPDLHQAFAITTLKHKVAYFVRKPGGDQRALAAYLTAELG
ncbi:DUF4123 domain-containing protein [Pseudomonas sp. ANT_H14]|uniref:DUF4123 domain-containing protein n=1 Tax=unclassified Pseudomonas TaxID=196821 RepID=UPI0011EC343B|nr:MULTISPECIES: DUF4123 domain-containing protein [unclassified Pseudomonas]KAA0949103.1 DUF4123 domain-containing protein [Pseudomonas sp. ANT_H4]KAA0954119.1 DUF4123 domain-containing protein [Pseudomonas sp. ANT_H14]